VVGTPVARSLRETSPMTELGSMISALALVIAAIFGIALLVRRFLPVFAQRSHGEGPLQRLGMLALTPQCSVALVRVGQETLVLGLTTHSVTLLTKSVGGASDQSAIRHPQCAIEQVEELNS
jgi:flagellar biosynthetic protein FliO